jgi:tetratricopeptide (TPR) repeat protein
MAAIRIRVIWDETTIEDHVHAGSGTLRIGAGPAAHVIAPGREGRYVTITTRGAGLSLVIPPGGADAIEFPGEERLDLTNLETPFVRQLDPPYGSGKLQIGAAVVEFQRADGLPATTGRQSDVALIAISACAVLFAVVIGFDYTLKRLFGDGDKPQWGAPPSINDRDASRMRVRIGPDGLGASRPQAGLGVALHGKHDVKRIAPQIRPPVSKPALKAVAARPKRVASTGPVVAKVQTGEIKGKNPEGPEQATAVTKTPPNEKTRTETIEDAQSALLAADLRRAIDSFSHASQKGPLDYDQLNWLGLAHYLSGELEEAEKVWEQARMLDGGRPDAVNNLASVAKRRGNGDAELEYLKRALEIAPEDCHASNSLALAQAKYGKGDALATLAKSDVSCGGNYAYTAIQKAGILAMKGKVDDAFKELETGLSRVDTLIPIKEFEVLTDLKLDPAFQKLRESPKFAQLVSKYLPRAATWQIEDPAEL